MNEEVNMSEKKKLINIAAAPVADNQNVMPIGPRFYIQKWREVLLPILPSSHQNQSIIPLMLI